MINPDGGAISRGRIALTYLWRHWRIPRLSQPLLFTELVQHRKLMDRDPRLPLLTDKVLVKAWVADRLGADWVIPTLWQGRDLPNEPEWSVPFVVKSRHGCNQRAFVRTELENWIAIQRRARGRVRTNYGYWLDEWAYRGLTPGLLVEPFIGKTNALPIDYKFYVFAGRVELIQVHLEREHAHRWIQFDRQWCRVSAPTSHPDPPRPEAFAQMIAAAETLGHDFDFVRVDLYANGERALFSEMTFYPGSGLDPFSPVSLNVRMGKHWLNAMRLSTSRP